MKIAGLEHTLIACCATDGSDGPTDAAGAWVDGSTVRRAAERHLDPRAYLADNDSNTFFERLGGLIVTGPTNTNVNDLTFVFVA
jgi:glycerate 2-kinase